MDDYSEMSENTTTRGSFMYQTSGGAHSIAPGSSGYGRRSNSSSMQQQQQEQEQSMALNRFHDRSSEFFVSEVHPNVKIEGGSSQTLHEFNYPFVRGAHQTVQQRQQQSNESSSDIDAIKAKIVAHPQYSNLLEAYMACQKVGAPPEVVDQLTAIGREFETRQRSSVICRDDSRDPELDQFMEAYYDMLVKYREELTRPIQEAMEFMRRIESQLNALSNGSVRVFSSGKSLQTKTHQLTDRPPPSLSLSSFNMGTNQTPCRAEIYLAVKQCMFSLQV